MASFDPEKLRLPPDLDVQDELKPTKKLSKTPRINGLFVKGPIPWCCLLKAMALPGKALHVALLLWQRRGMVKGRAVHLCLTTTPQSGIPTRTAQRAMTALEGAGLVKVKRKPGSGLSVTILDVEDDDNATNPCPK